MTGSNTSPPDRNNYRPLASRNRLQSLRNSLAGLTYMIRHEQSIQLLSVYTVLVFAGAFWVRLDSLPLVVLLTPLGGIWVVECLNTAVEATVDLAMSELHPLAKIAKDVSSAATFLSALLSAVVTLVVLVPPVLERLVG